MFFSKKLQLKNKLGCQNRRNEYLVVIGGSTNINTVRICRELIFKYGRRIVNADFFDARDDILYDLEEYYVSNRVRMDSWFYTFSEQIDTINERRRLYDFVALVEGKFDCIVQESSGIIDLSEWNDSVYGKDRIGGNSDHVIDAIQKQVLQMKGIPILHLVRSLEGYQGGLSWLNNFCFGSGAWKKLTSNEAYFTLKQLFKEFENGNI